MSIDTEDDKLIPSMVIMPNGDIIDIDLVELPVGRIVINNRSYRIVHSHLSCVPQWKYVLTLG